MAKLLAVAAVLAISLVARPASAAPQTDARSAARGFANATLKASKQLHPVRDEALAAPTIAGLHACLDDWAARPESLTNEVFAFYEVVIAAPLWPVERPPQAQWVADLARVRGVGALPSLRDARRTLKAQLAYVDALYAEPVDACAEVRAWRAADWEERPPQVARILRLRSEAGPRMANGAGPRRKVRPASRRCGRAQSPRGRVDGDRPALRHRYLRRRAARRQPGGGLLRRLIRRSSRSCPGRVPGGPRGRRPPGPARPGAPR